MNIAIFASGGGSNALEIIRRFREKGENGRVALLVTDRTGTGAEGHARKYDIPCETVTPKMLRENPGELSDLLVRYGIDFIALAGFLALIPAEVTRRFSGRMVNIHPSLLPDYGGKGMYGDRVHRAVLADGQRKTGITVHYVNEIYDDGEIIFQAETDVTEDETLESLKEKIRRLEHANYPRVIEECLKKL